MKEPIYTDDDPFCPYCEAMVSEEIENDWDYLDGETHEVVCQQCKEKFYILISRHIEFGISKESFE